MIRIHKPSIVTPATYLVATLIALTWIGKTTTSSGQSRAEAIAPAETFSVSAVELWETGWRLRAIELQDTQRPTTLSLVFGRDSAATRLSAGFVAGELRSFSRAPVQAAPERRVYHREWELFDAMTRGPAMGLDIGCYEYLLAFGDHPDRVWIPVEPRDYYIEVDASRGPGAGKAAADGVVRADRQHLSLVRVDRIGRDAALVFGGGDGLTTVYLDADDTGRVVGYQRRWSPTPAIARQPRRYAAAAQAGLINALVTSGPIAGVRWLDRGATTAVDDRPVPLQLELRDQSVTIDPRWFADIEPDER